MNYDFDYEELERCKWGVPCKSEPEGERDCGEPATYRIWWDNYEKAIPICTEHLTIIKNAYIL